MKQYLWIIGLAIVILGAFGYAFSGGDTSSTAWMASTISEVVGGIVLIVSFLSYHTPSGKRR